MFVFEFFVGVFGWVFWGCFWLGFLGVFGGGNGCEKGGSEVKY